MAEDLAGVWGLTLAAVIALAAHQLPGGQRNQALPRPVVTEAAAQEGGTTVVSKQPPASPPSVAESLAVHWPILIATRAASTDRNDEVPPKVEEADEEAAAAEAADAKPVERPPTTNQQVSPCGRGRQQWFWFRGVRHWRCVY